MPDLPDKPAPASGRPAPPAPSEGVETEIAALQSMLPPLPRAGTRGGPPTPAFNPQPEENHV
jgi:hypothetical protein